MLSIAQNDYNLSIGLTYVSGCGSLLEYDNGVIMGNYSRCESNFNTLLNLCKTTLIILSHAIDIVQAPFPRIT